MGAEHAAQQGKVCLVAQGNGVVLTPYYIYTRYGSGQVNAQTGLGGVVAVACVVQHAGLCAQQSACHQTQGGKGCPVVVPSGLVANASAPIAGVSGRVVRAGEGSAKQTLVRDAAVCHAGHAKGFAKEGELRTAVFHGRQISVQLGSPAYAQHEGVGGGAVVRSVLRRGEKAQCGKQERRDEPLQSNHRRGAFVRSFHLPRRPGSFPRRGQALRCGLLCVHLLLPVYSVRAGEWVPVPPPCQRQRW